jgi:hypothetical protein
MAQLRPGWANFCLLGYCLLWEVFLNTEEAHNFGLLISTIKLTFVLILSKNGWRFI